jgi:hypothetical protein
MERADDISATTAADKDAITQGGDAAAEARPGGRSWSSERGVAKPARGRAKFRARQAAHASLIAARQPTSRVRMLPSFLIVGQARCGTTSMFDVLEQHPAVFHSLLPKKEVHYFDLDYGHSLAWYQCHFPLVASARRATRDLGVAPMAFEASPYYMFHPLAPERIHRDLPGVKVLVLVRDPVERAYSAHAHQTGFGGETEPFERALELEDSRLEGETERLIADPAYISFNHRFYAYRTRGYYVDQLEHLERVFGRERIHVIDCGDFFADPGPVYDQVIDFLGLPHLGQPTFTGSNARPRSPMSGKVRAELEEHYRPYDERLAVWLGRQPSWRRQSVSR